MLLSASSFSEKEWLERQELVREAHTWIMTPYYWLADKKGIGVDCAMILVRCFVDTGIIPPMDPRPYEPEWHLHRSEEKYLRWMETLAVEVERPAIGDIAVFRYGRCFSHSGIIINQGQMIHSFIKDKACVIADIHSCDFTNRPVKYFNVWGAR